MKYITKHNSQLFACPRVRFGANPLLEAGINQHASPLMIDFSLLCAKPFYKRIAFNVAVTLIHVVNEASESFWKMHEEFLWQEMKICKNNTLRTYR
jgi:hypothetical protein